MAIPIWLIITVLTIIILTIIIRSIYNYNVKKSKERHLKEKQEWEAKLPSPWNKVYTSLLENRHHYFMICEILDEVKQTDMPELPINGYKLLVSVLSSGQQGKAEISFGKFVNIKRLIS